MFVRTLERQSYFFLGFLAGDLVGNFNDYAVRYDLIDFSFLIFCFYITHFCF